MALTHAQRKVADMRASKLQVMEWLEWSEEEYNEYYCEQGLAVLDRTMQNEAQRLEMASIKEWWSIWQMEWYAEQAHWVHHFNTMPGTKYTTEFLRMSYTGTMRAEKFLS